MDPISLFLLVIAGIFLIGVAGEVVFQRTSVPDVVWLIAAGIVLGPLTGFVSRAALEPVAPYFTALTLVVVVFDGGSRLELDALWRAAPRATVLALATFVLATAAVALVTSLAALVGLLPGWTLMHGLLTGTILGGSCSLIVMPTVARGGVEPKLANLVSLESAITDVLCVVAAMTLMDLMASHAADAPNPLAGLARNFGVGLLLGLAGGAVWLVLLKCLGSSEHGYPVTLAGLLVLYVVTNALGGSAALAVLACAIVVGNAPMLAKVVPALSDVRLGSDVRGFHSQLVFIIKSFFFTFIGLMLSPPWTLLVLGLVLTGVLLLARAPGVWLALAGSGVGRPARQLVTFALPRGMAAGVLATMPHHAGVPGTEELPTLVFACVVTSILLFAGGFSVAQRRLTQPAPEAPAPTASGLPGA